MTRILTFARKNFDAVLTIAGAILVAALGLFGVVKLEIVASATLMVLSLIGLSLLLSRAANSRLYQTMETALARLQKPSAEQILTPFKDYLAEIEQRLWLANDVWVLSRSCSRIWQDFNEQFMRLLSDNTGAVRLMLVDPDSSATKMIVDFAEWDRSTNVALRRANTQDFLTRLAGLIARSQNGRLQVRTIDYLPAWTLILIDPLSARGAIYVELATFRSNSRSRPTFSLAAERDDRLFQNFRTEFEAMWERAQPLDVKAYAEEPIQ